MSQSSCVFECLSLSLSISVCLSQLEDLSSPPQPLLSLISSLPSDCRAARPVAIIARSEQWRPLRLSLTVSFCLRVSLSLSISVYLLVSQSVYECLSLSLSVSVCLSLSLSVSVCLLIVSICLYVSQCVFECLSLSLSVSV